MKDTYEILKKIEECKGTKEKVEFLSLYKNNETLKKVLTISMILVFICLNLFIMCLIRRKYQIFSILLGINSFILIERCFITKKS